MRNSAQNQEETIIYFQRKPFFVMNTVLQVSRETPLLCLGDFTKQPMQSTHTIYMTPKKPRTNLYY